MDRRTQVLSVSSSLLKLFPVRIYSLMRLLVETILVQDPHVKAAVMFGRGQFQNGILVDPKPEYAFDPVDEAQLVEFRNLIW